ncbi:MAG: iron-containing alcohol dehydrogenase family protein [Armatimonadota bacterium]
MAEIALRCAREVIFGSGVRTQLGQQAALLGRRALIVTGRRALRESGALGELREILAGADVASVAFSEVEAEPSLTTVERGRSVCRAEGCDLVVAAGGGSALDVGKAVAALVPLPDPVAYYFAGAQIPGQGLPCIALPTTSGTGAEVTPNAVLTDTATDTKASIRGRALLPEIALVDPELTLSCPPDQTAWSGLDALTQAIESLVSTGANPISSLLAEEAIRRIAGSLRRAVADGSQLHAREEMALGSLLAGLALASARLGLVHGLAHPLGARYHLPHGLVCGALLPHVMQYNLSTPAADQFARVAVMLGVGESAQELVAWVRKLVRDLGAELDFAAAGLCPEDFGAIIPPTLSSGSTRHNPRAVEEESLRELLMTLLR